MTSLNYQNHTLTRYDSPELLLRYVNQQSGSVLTPYNMAGINGCLAENHSLKTIEAPNGVLNDFDKHWKNLTGQLRFLLDICGW